MKRKLLTISLGLLLAVAVAGGIVQARYLAASADMDTYRQYFVNDTAPPANGAVRVTFLGTTTLLIDDGRTQLMTDGFFSRPSLWRVVASRLSTDTAQVDAVVSALKIDRLKALMVAHSHYDHAFDIAYVAKRTGATVHGSPSTLNIARGGGVPASQMLPYQPGKAFQVGDFTVTILDSRHSPALPGINDDLGQLTPELAQPAKASDYKEGGSYDMLIEHGGRRMLIKPSTNYLPGALDNIRAEVVFLGVGSLGTQPASFQDTYYDQTVGKLKPGLVIPIHWDNFFQPLNDHLQANPKLAGNLQAGLDYLIRRTSADGISFRLLQGYQSVLLFSDTRK